MKHHQASTSRAAMTLIELMIALVVLVVAIGTAVSQMAVLKETRRNAQEQEAAQGLAQSISERIQGARWADLGTDQARYSYPRLDRGGLIGVYSGPEYVAADDSLRSDGFAPVDLDSVFGPMRDDAACVDDTSGTPDLRNGRVNNGLQTMGLLAAPSGLSDCRVYVEYYRSLTIRDALGNLPTATTTDEGGVLVRSPPGIMDGETTRDDTVLPRRYFTPAARDAEFPSYVGVNNYYRPADFFIRFRFDERWEETLARSRAPVDLVDMARKARHLYRLDTRVVPSAQVGENDPVSIRILVTWGRRGQGGGAVNLFTARKQ